MVRRVGPLTERETAKDHAGYPPAVRRVLRTKQTAPWGFLCEAELCNGSTNGSDPFSLGSNPSSAAKKVLSKMDNTFFYAVNRPRTVRNGAERTQRVITGSPKSLLFGVCQRGGSSLSMRRMGAETQKKSRRES